VIFREGQAPAGLYILRNGAATISTKANGREFAITVQTTAGSLLDLPGLICTGKHTFTAMAHDGAELSFVKRADFLDLMNSDLQLNERILKAIAVEIDFSSRAIMRKRSSRVRSERSSMRSSSSIAKLTRPLAAESSAAWEHRRRDAYSAGYEY
jgi:CRP-like cAMP-binding protein